MSSSKSKAAGGSAAAAMKDADSADWVVDFDEDTPEPLLELLKPDVLVKGGDYGPDECIGPTHRRGHASISFCG